MKKSRRGSRKTKKKSLNIGFKQIIAFTFIGALLGYLIYFLITYVGISTVDPTVDNGSQYYLLSQQEDSFQSTLWIFEEGLGDERKIDKVFVHVYNKEKERSLLIYVPEWVYYSGLEEDFGNAISVSSFRYAGDFLQEGRGVEYSLWQLNQMLGIKVDDYIWFTTESLEIVEDSYGDLVGSSDSLLANYGNSDDTTEDFLYLNKFVKSISSLETISHIAGLKSINDKEGVYSNLSFNKVLKEVRATKKILSNLTTSAIDLGYVGYTEEEMSESGGLINYFDSTLFDAEYRVLISKMIDRDLEKERVRVEVYNGSGVSGAARQFGRKVENSGCDVVRYENAPRTVEKTTLYVSDVEGFKYSLEVVKETLSGTFDLVEGRPEFMTTGDIVIVLGQDIKQMYSF